MQVSFTAIGGVALNYRLKGQLDSLRIPPPHRSEFIDGLWEHTCFEVFFAVAGSDAYREFYFSPSGQWAAYAFRNYRERDEFAIQELSPQISVTRFADHLELNAVLEPTLLPSAPPGANLQLGLSAVIEAADGSRSYWALAHPAAQPDFHHRAAMTLTLATDKTTLSENPR